MSKDERGFTVVSLLLVLAVASIVAVGGGMTTAQITGVTRQSADYATAVRQAQNLGFWVSQDLLNADTVNATDDPSTPETEFITFNWKDMQTGNLYETRYSWSDPYSPLKKVMRKYATRDNQGVPTGSTVTLVADSIASADLSLQAGDRWRLTVAAQSGDKTRTRRYEISKRVQ
ncbi:MAG: hypothetical protein A2137_00675 [Chloroflexi bacterium RBG_16_58_8]|nr:MAG: hypothetical protein A2137_00675 [Chloroflexi bacterium RBG_16_58_8]